MTILFCCFKQSVQISTPYDAYFVDDIEDFLAWENDKSRSSMTQQLIFLDTEFTGLAQRWPRLISIGLVSEDGSREFYAELTAEGCMERSRRGCARTSCRSWRGATGSCCRAICAGGSPGGLAGLALRAWRGTWALRPTSSSLSPCRSVAH